MATFKSLVGSILTYATPVWFRNTSETSINRLQLIQNSSLHIATGCVRMTPIDHLHAETEVLKVDEHLKMLWSQYLAACLQPDHASFSIVNADSGLRRKNATLQRGFANRSVKCWLTAAWKTSRRPERQSTRKQCVRRWRAGVQTGS